MGSSHVMYSLFAPTFVSNNSWKFLVNILTSVVTINRFALPYRSIIILHTCSIIIGNVQFCLYFSIG